MKCEQFDSRVQQLLDDRSSLSLDLQIQKHALECDYCQYSLEIYKCFSEHSVPKQTVQLADACPPSEFFWKKRQHRFLRNRIVMSAAAILFISLILLARPPAPSSVLINELPILKFDDELVRDAVVSESNMFDSLDVPGLFTGSWAGRLSEGSFVDFSYIGEFNLVSLIPEDPVRAVQSIPVSLERIQPIYRYSTELPVLNQWSSSIYYTIGLIQNSLPGSSESRAPDPDRDDLGSTNFLSRLDLC